MTAYGRGPIVQRGVVYYHSIKETTNRFRYWPTPIEGSADYCSWSPVTDTLFKPHEFCTNCKYVRRESDGVELWECLGHDKVANDDLPKAPEVPTENENALDPPDVNQGDELLKGKRFVETFSGDPKRGGEALANAWMHRGGEASCRDILKDKKHDFFKDNQFWEKEFASPADAYSFAPECKTFSIAHTTPVLRTKENPYGDEKNHEVKKANDMARLLVKRVLRLIAAGAHVLIENPLMSYFWMLDEVQILMGLPEMTLVRIDQCTRGTRYQKPQLWLTTNA